MPRIPKKLALFIWILLFASLSLAQTADPAKLPAIALDKSEIYERSLGALTMLFVIAVLLESAFALLFSWRVFLTYFSVTGVKTIIMFAIAWVVVYKFGVDILASLINVYRKDPIQSQVVSQLITAMILAGGSATVNKIFIALGLRSIPIPPMDIRPPELKAWVAVNVKQGNSKNRVMVHLKDGGVAQSNDPAPISGTACFGAPNLLQLLGRNRNRFPSNGGCEIIPGHVYELFVSGFDSDCKEVKSSPIKFVCANRAILDFDIKL